MNAVRMLGGAAMLAAVWGCKVRARDSDEPMPGAAGVPDVAGTYVAADSGTTLGKKWCYSGALVLDSTQHFGSVLTMCSDDGNPVTEHIKGTYRLRSTTIRAGDGDPALKRLDVILSENGRRGKRHNLRYVAGALKFNEPWWLGAGLRALDIPDPVLKKIEASLLSDSTGLPKVSSTPVVVAHKRIRIPPPAGKSPGRGAPAK